VEQVNTTSEVRNRFRVHSFGTQFHNPLGGLKNPNPNFKVRKTSRKQGEPRKVEQASTTSEATNRFVL
jgi:hypothetical protein